MVLVSQVHRCSSYARLLTSQKGGKFALGLSIEPPGAPASVHGSVNWVKSAIAGNFKSNSAKTGDRGFYPLYRLVALRDNGPANGFRDADGVDPPLPDAVIPWVVGGPIPASDD